MKRNIKIILPAFLIVLMVITGCGKTLEEKGSKEYIAEINQWHNKRIENLKKENGWLNLAGLFWLNEGENKFGSAKSNQIIFPEKAPAFIGTITLKDSVLTFKAADAVEVLEDSQIVKETNLVFDMQGKPTVLQVGSLKWFIIKRGDKYGIRLRDLEADLVKNFPGIETYPINSDWKIEARLDKYEPPKEIEVPNILGMIEKEKSPGAIVFNKEGKEYRLDVTDAGNSYFIVFADITSGKETYGAGRFLSVEKPKEGEKLFIDFNRAYNPPCAFTKYATCPLPPKQNHLKLEITAGEKNFGKGH